ncbi:uncharacterized protein JN550_005991 [Neoarthrinium moseri]|uniref:uncharacterized protein n=1 Tax=Neoarthrinium moseri TaxID=1658444 RepID=UPI001FDE78A2|nr:uncharacterized protein JN550_005991 [Neoarthrinium moseri]KAI1869361.1 hypothetical protein JN550_005991 [Neoarthrinium moseri]
MSGRVEKSSRSKKTLYRLSLADRIERCGVDVMPCSFCEKRNLRCRMMEGVSRCKECCRRGRSCDGSGVTLSSLQRINAEEDRLVREEEVAEEKLLRAQQEVNEALSKLMRLRAQKRALKTRGVDMVNRGLRSLDELDEQERAESDAVVAVQSQGGVGVIDWSSVGIPGIDWDALGGTSQGVQHSSSSAS